MTQPGEIDGVTKQMNQSFNPVISGRIQETMRNPTVLKWLALPHRVVWSNSPDVAVEKRYGTV